MDDIFRGGGGRRQVQQTFFQGREEGAIAALLFPRGRGRCDCSVAFSKAERGLRVQRTLFQEGELHTFSKEELGKVQCNMPFANEC